MNPCPCGYYGDPVKPCTCSPGTVTKYQKRISGPLLDRIDIHIEVPRVEYDKLSDLRLGEPSAVVQARVESGPRKCSASALPALATALMSRSLCNADMRPAEVRQFCQLDDTGRALMRTAMNQLQLSARAYHRVLKLARTIADLAGSESIAPAAPGGGAAIPAEGDCRGVIGLPKNGIRCDNYLKFAQTSGHVLPPK